MKRNLEMTKGLYFSQSILLALTRAGLARKTAYEAVQRAAMKTWRGKKSLAENVKAERQIMTRIIENTPMVMPVIVRAARNLFAPSELSAIAMISRNRMIRIGVIERSRYS